MAGGGGQVWANVVVSSAGGFEALVKGIKEGALKSVAVLTGAGISTAAGIPDFRSAGGMYEQLRPELLTASAEQREAMAQEPTLVVDWELFSVNQLPYLEVRRPFILGTAEGKWRPTLGHFFLRLLEDRGLLRRLYSQNIDGLDHALGLPPERLVKVHGSLASISCEFCASACPSSEFCTALRSSVRDIYETGDPSAPALSSPIPCPSCGRNGLKPDTVLFGRQLPAAYFAAVAADFPAPVDLLLCVGTSLTVHPAAALVTKVAPSTLRLVVNQAPVGRHLGLSFTEGSSDLLLQGDCDSSFLALSSALGWLPQLASYRSLMAEQSRVLLDQALKSQP
ncbi:MAG: Sir2 family NAD-dependent protein deacetylase [archaeon]|nr:Sir2 family NAD-dependent protein deacetylase [archaeon]